MKKIPGAVPPMPPAGLPKIPGQPAASTGQVLPFPGQTPSGEPFTQVGQQSQGDAQAAAQALIDAASAQTFPDVQPEVQQAQQQATPQRPVPPAGYSMLPTGPRVEKSKLSDASILVYGDYKIGKSTLASQAPTPLYVPTERGIGFLYCDPVRNADGTTKIIQEWGELDLLRAEIDGLKAAGIAIPFETLVIDTLNNLWEMACARIVRERGVQDIADVGQWSAGYRLAGDKIKDLLQWSTGLGMGNIFCGHAKQVEVEDRYGKTQRWTLNISESGAKHFLRTFDMILFMENEPSVREDGTPSERRVIRCNGSRNWTAGDRSRRLPGTIIIPDDPDKMFPALQTAFDLGPFPPRSTFDYEAYLSAIAEGEQGQPQQQ